MTVQRRADFFVHPDYYRATGFGAGVGAEVEQYEEALRRRIGTSFLPVLMYDPQLGAGIGDFWDRFSPLHRFPTRPSDGVLSHNPNEHTRFNQFLQENRVVGGVVHGSYLEACVIDFKSHLAVGDDQVLSALPPDHQYTIGPYDGPESVR